VWGVVNYPVGQAAYYVNVWLHIVVHGSEQPAIARTMPEHARTRPAVLSMQNVAYVPRTRTIKCGPEATAAAAEGLVIGRQCAKQ